MGTEPRGWLVGDQGQTALPIWRSGEGVAERDWPAAWHEARKMDTVRASTGPAMRLTELFGGLRAATLGFRHVRCKGLDIPDVLGQPSVT